MVRSIEVRAALAARHAAHLLLPPVCAACRSLLPFASRSIVCGACWTRLALLPHPQCDRCGHPCVDARCRWCELLPPFVRCARSVCWMPEGSAGPVVHAFKYDGWHVLAQDLASRMARLAWPADVVNERSAVVPVPLSRTRERERGYNQSALVARLLAAHWSLPTLDAVLARTRSTRTQARLTPEQRLRNVAGAFRVDAPSARLRGRHLILVDDVVTTAATLNACAAALFDGGARTVSYVTFGRARSPGDVST